MRFKDREWWGELFRFIVGAALLLAGMLCVQLGSLVLIAASAPAVPELQPSHAPPVSPPPSQTQEVTALAEVVDGEGFEFDDDETRLWVLGVAAFLLGLGALLILASMWVGRIGEPLCLAWKRALNKSLRVGVE